jgi:hypothetical protein
MRQITGDVIKVIAANEHLLVGLPDDTLTGTKELLSANLFGLFTRLAKCCKSIMEENDRSEFEYNECRGVRKENVTLSSNGILTRVSRALLRVHNKHTFK